VRKLNPKRKEINSNSLRIFYKLEKKLITSKNEKKKKLNSGVLTLATNLALLIGSWTNRLTKTTLGLI
jgi:hypothetical protein